MLQSCFDIQQELTYLTTFTLSQLRLKEIAWLPNFTAESIPCLLEVPLIPFKVHLHP